MKNLKKGIYRVLLLTFLAIFIFSAYQVYLYAKQSVAVNKINNNLIEQAMVVESNTETTEEEETFKVNFDVLWEENKDIIAWIYCEDTLINYPIVQSDNNDYYLRRLLDGTWNIAGTLFADFRNSADFTDWNTVIYGHNMANDTMFGSLLNYKNQAYYDEHPVINLYTPETNYIIELIAGYVTTTESVIYDFPMDQEGKNALVEDGLNLSNFIADIEISPEDKIISLTTCYNGNDNTRYVLIGRLVKN